MNISFMVAQFLGGLGLFFYAVNTLSDSLQKLAANKIRNILESLTKTTWLATLFGIFMTLALQSSASTTVMVVEFVNAGLMTLSQGLSVSLGASLGTYITIQLISLPLFSIALWMIFFGFLLFFIYKKSKAKIIGQCFISFGCMFVGMTFMSNAFSPLREMNEVYLLLHQYCSVPILGILAGFALTALMQSSSVFLAIMISMAMNGLLSIHSIIPLVLGAHIGGTFTTLITSLGTEKIDAKRVAIANTLYRVILTLLLFPFFTEFAQIIKWISPDMPRQVVNAYFFSTILMVLLFLPFNTLVAKGLIKFIKLKDKDGCLKLKYIDKGALQVPAIALNQATKELRWMGQEILEYMFEVLPRLLISQNQEWISEIEDTEGLIDWYYLEISQFLSDLFNQELSKEQIILTQNIQLIAKEWEQIADRHIIIARLIEKMNLNNISFEDDDFDCIDDIYTAISKKFLKVLKGFEHRNNSNDLEITDEIEDILALHNDLRVKIVCNCTKGFERNKNIILDLENSIFQIGQHLKNIAFLLSLNDLKINMAS